LSAIIDVERQSRSLMENVMNTALWLLQGLFAMLFLMIGSMKVYNHHTFKGRPDEDDRSNRPAASVGMRKVAARPPSTSPRMLPADSDAPDRLFDPAPEHLATLFGARARELMLTGRDPFEAARLAASFAFQARPELRLVTKRIGLRPEQRSITAEMSQKHLWHTELM
jgi:hypothetical protein